MDFIKKVFEKNIDEKVHSQFIRFGKGEYGGRFPLSLRKTKKVKLKASFEFTNELVELCSTFGKCKVSGIILSKNNLSSFMSEKGISGNSQSKKGGLYYQNNIEEQEMEGELLRELEEKSYCSLLDLEGEDFKLKTKKKLPKPGKREDKIDDKFCQLEADEKYYLKIKEYFFWDAPESRKLSVKHSIIINEILFPEGEKDYSKVRELAKRKGKIIRKIMINDEEIIRETNFEA